MIGNIMEKVLADLNYCLGVALGWCLSTKKCLNSYGYSPNQLVFRFSPNFPSVIDIKL